MEMTMEAKSVLGLLDRISEVLQGHDHAAAILALVKMTGYLIADSKLESEMEKALLQFVIRTLQVDLEEMKKRISKHD